MKEIRTQEEDFTYRKVKTGKLNTVVTYETVDGKTFSDKPTAIRHEFQLRYNSIEKIEIDIPEFGWQWFKAKDEEELSMLKQSLHDPYDTEHGMDKIKVGEWFSVYHEDGGDYRSVDYFYILQDLKEAFENALEKLK